MSLNTKYETDGRAGGRVSAWFLGVMFVAWLLGLSAGASELQPGKNLENPSRSSERGVRFGVSGPVMIVDGEALWGAGLHVMGEVSPQLYAGVETGFYYWSASAGDASANVWAVPLLGTLLYEFETKESAFTPFLGIGLGPSFAHGSVSAGSLSASDSATQFTFLAHAGAKIGREKNFFTDVKLGAIGGDFTVLPSLGYFF